MRRGEEEEDWAGGRVENVGKGVSWLDQRTIFDFAKLFVSEENVFLINRRNSWLGSI